MKLKNVLKRPIVTEKSSMAMSMGWYTFEVDKKANKSEIASAIEKFYQVTVTKVRTMNMNKMKKALVQLKQGDKIEAFQTGD